jgi:deoxyribonuclease V
LTVPGLGWPERADELAAVQLNLASARPPPWHPPEDLPEDLTVAGCFACLPRGRSGPGAAGDPVWAGAAAYHGRRCVGRATATGTAAGPYRPGLLALRVGAPLAAAVPGLPYPPGVVLVDATGRDHPRRAGLAIHLGAALDLPTVGVTHRPLLAAGDWPPDETGAASPLRLDGVLVGYWLRTRAGRRPVAVHAGWRTDPETALRLVLAAGGLRGDSGAARRPHRTPAPLREARRLARLARAAASTAGPLGSG